MWYYFVIINIIATIINEIWTKIFRQYVTDIDLFCDVEIWVSVIRKLYKQHKIAKFLLYTFAELYFIIDTIRITWLMKQKSASLNERYMIKWFRDIMQLAYLFTNNSWLVRNCARMKYFSCISDFYVHLSRQFSLGVIVLEAIRKWYKTKLFKKFSCSM